MAPRTPKNADEFVLAQLDERAKELRRCFASDLLTFSGPLLAGADDIIREVVEDMKSPPAESNQVTIVLTTSGGYVEVVQRIVTVLRQHWDHVNFVIPNYAFSAGTILVMSGDTIWMDYYSCLGPIDPQVESQNNKMVPALGYLEQYERLRRKASRGKLTMAELEQMIRGFDQAELYKYEQERDLSIALLKEWLVKYKFKNWTITEDRKIPVTDKMRVGRAATIAKTLNNTNRWHSHGYGISMAVLRSPELNLRIDDFGQDAAKNSCIRTYYRLLDDYMVKRGHNGVIHTVGTYLPLI